MFQLLLTVKINEIGVTFQENSMKSIKIVNKTRFLVHKDSIKTVHVTIKFSTNSHIIVCYIIMLSECSPLKATVKSQENCVIQIKS